MKTKILGAEDMAELLGEIGRDRLMDLMLEALRARFSEHDDETVEVRNRDGFR